MVNLLTILNKFKHFWFNPNPRTKKINRNIVYSFGLKGLGILISLFLVPMTLGYLNEYEYGVWIALNSVLTWINVLDIGLGNGLRNKLAECIARKDLEKGKIYVSTTFALLTVISLSICILALIVNMFIDWNSILNIKDPIDNLNNIVNIVLICLSINFTIRTVGVVYLSFQETFLNGLFMVLGSFLSLVWIFVLTKFSEPSLMNVALAFSLSPIIIYLIAYPFTFYIMHKEIKPSFRHIRKEYVKSLGGLGMKFFILQLACLSLFLTSNLLISNIYSPAEVTPYSISYKYFNVLSSVFMIIINPMWSGITDAYVMRDVKWLAATMRKIQFLYLLSVIGIIVMLLISQFVYRIWVGSDVYISWGLSISMAVFNIAFIWCNLYSAWVNGVGHLRLALYSMCSAAVIFIPLCFLVTRFLGLPGVATALTIALMIPCTMLYIQYKRDMRNLKKEQCLNQSSVIS